MQSSAGPSALAPSITLTQAHHTSVHTANPLSHRPRVTLHEPQPAHSSVPGPHSFFDGHVNSLALSAHTKHRVTQAIQSAWADSTRRRYSGAICQFLLFCDKEHVPTHLRFPADKFVLCAFAASSLGKHTGGTPKARLSALKAWHISHNVEWKGSSQLRFVLNGVANHAPGSSSHPPHPPINARMLIQLIEALDRGLYTPPCIPSGLRADSELSSDCPRTKFGLNLDFFWQKVQPILKIRVRF